MVVDSEINIKNGENLECDYYYNLSKCYKNNLLNKTENDYPYYPDYNNGDFFYIDIINYLKSNIENLKSNNNNAKKIWPKFIEDIKDTKNRDNKKRLFRIKAGKYIYFKDTLYVNKNLDYFIINNKITTLIIKDKNEEISNIIKNNNKIYRVPKLI